MLATLIALSPLPMTASTPSLVGLAGLAGCTAGRATGCHPYPTKSKSCREVLIEQKAPKEAALAEAR